VASRSEVRLPGTTAGSHGQKDQNTSSTKIQFRLPEDLTDAALRQAAESGIIMNLLGATAVAARVGARAEAERYFTARGSRTTSTRAKALLAAFGNVKRVARR
jgi:hypothetical protein